MTRIVSAYAYQLAKCQQCNVAVTNCRSAADVLCLGVLHVISANTVACVCRSLNVDFNFRLHPSSTPLVPAKHRTSYTLLSYCRQTDTLTRQLTTARRRQGTAAVQRSSDDVKQIKQAIGTTRSAVSYDKVASPK